MQKKFHLQVFYPMIARIPDDERARKLIHNLFDEEQFWGEYVVPTISKKSRFYTPDGDYWRGRIWPPVNYLVYEGIKRYDTEVAKLFAEKCKQILINEWDRHGHIHENYSNTTR